MKKKLFASLLILSSLVLVGCNNGATTNNPGGNPGGGGGHVNPSEPQTPVPTEGNYTYNTSNPAAQKVNISNLLSKMKSGSNGDKKLYSITGTVQPIINDYYGNFEFTDATGSLLVYGCSRKANCISKNERGEYSYSNQRNFESIKINGGDVVTLEGIFIVFTTPWGAKTLEFQGYPTIAKLNTLGDFKAEAYPSNDPYTGDYYNKINTNKDLDDELHDLMISTHHSYGSYNGLYSHFPHTDGSGSSFKCFYTGKTGKGKTFNREHVWPKSRSKDPNEEDSERVFVEDHAGSDMLHLRPSDKDVNSKRGNLLFNQLFGKEGNGLTKFNRVDGGTPNYIASGSNLGFFEPSDSIKGDVARIIAYVYIHYSNEVGTIQKSFTGDLKIQNVIAGNKNDAKKILCMWNAIDPVDSMEIARNNYAQKEQGNRNPFVDHPSYMAKIFG